jgi:EpsI family protein
MAPYRVALGDLAERPVSELSNGHASRQQRRHKDRTFARDTHTRADASGVVVDTPNAAPLPNGANPTALWPLYVALALAFAGAGAGLLTGLGHLHSSWTNAYSYSHGYLVLLLSGWLLLRALHAAPVAELRPSLLGFGLLVGTVAAYALAEVLDITIVIQATLPMLLLGVIAALGGWQLARRALVPIAFLYFAVPLWNLLTVPLQDLTTTVVTTVLRFSDTSAYIEGYIITTPSGTFEIAQGCSGLHFFVVGLALAAFYGLNWYREWSVRLLLVAVAGAVSLLANWARVYLLIEIGERSNMQHYLIAEDHYLFGWVLYGFLMAPVLLFARYLELRERRRAAAAASETGAGGDASEQRTGGRPRLGSSAVMFIVAGTAVGLVVSGPALLRAGPAAPETPERVVLDGAALADWRPTGPAGDWRPSFQRPYLVLHDGYSTVDGTIRVDAYVARYAYQGPNAKLVYFRNTLDRGWQTTGSRTHVVAFGDDSRTVTELVLAVRGERRLIWYWYRVGGVPTHERTRAKLLEVPALLRGRRDGAVVAVSARCAVRCDDARTEMAEFLAVAGLLLEALADGEEGSPIADTFRETAASH